MAGIQAAGIQAVLTQSRIAGMLPAEGLRCVALRYFGLRYLAAFGPEVPDGVISLDGMVLDGHGGPFAPSSAGLVTFAAADPTQPVYRPADALIASIAVHLATIRIAPRDRILTLLAPADLRGLVTGLGAALVAGAALETCGPFDAAHLAEALARPGPTHLVVPAALGAQSRGEPLPSQPRIRHPCSPVADPPDDAAAGTGRRAWSAKGDRCPRLRRGGPPHRLAGRWGRRPFFSGCPSVGTVPGSSGYCPG